MTNEEIEQETQLLCDVLQLCDTGEKEAEAIEAFLRRLVSQAYEGAAMKAFDYHASIRDRENPKFEGVDTAAKRRGGMTAADDIGKSIRALSESLVQESVAST